MNILKNSILLAIYFFLELFVISLKAQEPRFSQYDANLLYLNPAYTGATPYIRLISNYRVQWFSANSTLSNLDGRYDTFAFSGDYYFKRRYGSKTETGHGFGLQAIVDRNTNLGWVNTRLGFNYAMEILLNKAANFIDNERLRLGVRVGLNQLNIDSPDLVFEDAINNGNILSTVESLTSLYQQNTGFDLSFGLLYSTRRFWLGGTVFNLMDNSDLFNGGGSGDIGFDREPGFSLEGGVKTKTRKWPLKFSSRYRWQKQANQLDLSFSIKPPFFKPSKRYGIITGVFYRLTYNPSSTHAIAPSFAYIHTLKNLGKVIFQYSFDLNLSKNSHLGFIHEFTIRREFYKERNKQDKRREWDSRYHNSIMLFDLEDFNKVEEIEYPTTYPVLDTIQPQSSTSPILDSSTCISHAFELIKTYIYELHNLNEEKTDGQKSKDNKEHILEHFFLDDNASVYNNYRSIKTDTYSSIQDYLDDIIAEDVFIPDPQLFSPMLTNRVVMGSDIGIYCKITGENIVTLEYLITYPLEKGQLPASWQRGKIVKITKVNN